MRRRTSPDQYDEYREFAADNLPPGQGGELSQGGKPGCWLLLVHFAILIPISFFILRYTPLDPLEQLVAILIVFLLDAVLLVSLLLLAGEFLTILYDLKDSGEGFGFIERSLFGLPDEDSLFFGFFYGATYLLFKEGGRTRVPTAEDIALAQIGGPGKLGRQNTTGVVTEQCGRLRKVYARPGFTLTERFERPYAVVDLRPRHQESAVGGFTEDGIFVNCTFSVTFQIDPEDLEPTDEALFPVPPDNVFRTATATWAREAERFEDRMDWEGQVVGNAQGAIRGIIEGLSIDELIPVELSLPEERHEIFPLPEEVREVRTEGEEDPRLPPLMRPREDKAARQRIRFQIDEEFARRLQNSVRGLGVRILSAHIGTLEVDPKVREEWLALWQHAWRAWATERLGEGKAEKIEIIEDAKTQAHIDLLRRIADLIQQMEDAGRPFPRSVIALKFIEALRGAKVPSDWMQVYLPQQSLQTFEKLEGLLRSGKQKLPDEAQPQAGAEGPGPGEVR